MSDKNIPEIKIAPGALADIFLAIELCPIEVSGLGKVIREENVLVIKDDIIIPQQSCSMSGTEFDPVSYARWQSEMVRAGRRAEIEDFRLWWHSHVNSPAYFSPTDEKNIAQWGNSLEEWLLSVVGNKDGRFAIRLDTFRPKPIPKIFIKRVSFTIPTDREQFHALMITREEKIRRSIKEKVKTLNAADLPFERFEKIINGLFDYE